MLIIEEKIDICISSIILVRKLKSIARQFFLLCYSHPSTDTATIVSSDILKECSGHLFSTAKKSIAFFTIIIQSFFVVSDIDSPFKLELCFLTNVYFV